MTTRRRFTGEFPLRGSTSVPESWTPQTAVNYRIGSSEPPRGEAHLLQSMVARSQREMPPNMD